DLADYYQPELQDAKLSAALSATHGETGGRLATFANGEGQAINMGGHELEGVPGMVAYPYVMENADGTYQVWMTTVGSSAGGGFLSGPIGPSFNESREALMVYNAVDRGLLNQPNVDLAQVDTFSRTLEVAAANNEAVPFAVEYGMASQTELL